jgi:hypothetical protein
MSTDLRHRLEELADTVPPAPPPPDLWARGVRFRRRQRAGTLAILAVTAMLLVGIGGLGWQRSSVKLASAGAGEVLAVPDRIFAPSRWLPGTDSTGPLGTLAAVVQTGRGGWFGSSKGLVGVSAANGTYAFLDLPDLADHAWADAALAPDGRHLAYWLTGETSGSPNRQNGDPVTGVGVYDPTTGATRTWPVPTQHGLWPDRLAWADDGHLVIAFDQFMGGEGDDETAQSSGVFVPLQIWDLGQSAPFALVGTRASSLAGEPGGGRILIDGSGAGSTYRIVDVAAGGDDRRLTVSADLSLGGGPSISPDGRRIAAVYGNLNPNHIGVADVSASGRAARFEPVTENRTHLEVLGWLDEDHVVSRVVDLTRHNEVFGLARTDLSTGERSVLVAFPNYSGGANVSTALELLARPTRPAAAPPQPVDPRILAGGALVLVAAGGLALRNWRRRAPA